MISAEWFLLPTPPRTSPSDAPAESSPPSRPLPTCKLLELRQDRLKEVIVDLVVGTVVPNVEEIVH